MLRSIWLLLVYVSFLGLGVAAPFIASLGYVWVDTFQPQFVAYIILNQIPVSLIMGIAAFGSYFLFDRRMPPRMNLQTGLQIAMLIWTASTMLWAQAPEAAYPKFDVVWKTLLFATFVPYVMRSRAQIEAFTATYVFSLAANFMPFGAKVVLSGGGYGRQLGLQGGNTGLGEGGYLSTVCLMAVPLAIYLSQHGQLLPHKKIISLAYWMIAGLAVLCAIGTYERSALVGLVILGGYMWVRTKNKIGLGLVILLGVCALVYNGSSGWDHRISSIGEYQSDDSAMGRIAVWKWTLGFVLTHPFGGGFNTYVIDHIEIPGRNGQPAAIAFGKAFHSIYFEILGEHGYPGLLIFLLLTVISFWSLHQTGRRASRYPELQWVKGLSDALQSGMAVFLTSGAFVGIAFQPPFWYFVALSISLRAYLIRVEGAEHAGDRPGWRSTQVKILPQTDPNGSVGGWRNRPGRTLYEVPERRRNS